MIIRCLILGITLCLAGCGSIPKKSPTEIPIVREELIVHEVPTAAKELCVNAKKLAVVSVPDHRIATQRDWLEYTSKLKSALKICEAAVGFNQK